jgi:hypothetical protein
MLFTVFLTFALLLHVEGKPFPPQIMPSNSNYTTMDSTGDAIEALLILLREIAFLVDIGELDILDRRRIHNVLDGEPLDCLIAWDKLSTVQAVDCLLPA